MAARQQTVPVAPQDLEAEERVLGALMIEPRLAETLAEAVSPDDFYRKTHGQIFAVAVQMNAEDIPVDPVTLCDELSRKGILDEIGGRSRLHELAALVPIVGNAEHYARIVREQANLRGLLRAAGELQRLVASRPAEGPALLEMAERIVFDLSQSRARHDFVTVSDSLRETYDRLLHAYESGVEVTGLATGLVHLDSYTSGLQRGNLVILAARPSMGKALSLDTRVLTPRGWTTMGELSVGDEIIGGDGAPDVVSAVFDQGERDLYRVRFDDGAEVECCDEHLWITRTRNERRRDAPWRARPLSEIREAVGRQDGHGYNHVIPYVDPVQFEQPERLGIHPYLLGLYLGDGCTSSRNNVGFVTADQELLTSFVNLLSENDAATVREVASRPGLLTLHVKRRQRNNKRSDMLIELERLGLAGVRSHGKFVPRQYLYANRPARLELLQGLCDTDGYVTDPAGAGVEFCTVSERLRDDVLFLVRSLGGRATSSSATGVGAYRVNLTFPRGGLIPVRLERKRDKWKGRERGASGRPIVSVSSSGRAPCRCITVERGSYVVGDFVVTHNSALALGIASRVAVERELPVALYTLEMNRDEVNQRLIAIEASVDLRKVRNGRLTPEEWARVQKAFGTVSKAPIYVDDAGVATVLEVRSRARRLKIARPDLALIVVDYLQLMTSGNARIEDNRVQDVSAISRGLKVLARELDVPVLALSQLSRSPEQRHDKRPILSDLRESGAIEQDADLVLFVYRDEYYHPETAAEDGTEGVAELNVAKHRNGPTGTVRLSFLKRYARFGDLIETEVRR